MDKLSNMNPVQKKARLLQKLTVGLKPATGFGLNPVFRFSVPVRFGFQFLFGLKLTF